MTYRRGIKVSLLGTGIEAIGMVLDVLHHLSIGLETPEGLLTPIHVTIFVGFLINAIGVMLTLIASYNKD